VSKFHSIFLPCSSRMKVGKEMFGLDQELCVVHGRLD
jgi:hypothetical protein